MGEGLAVFEGQAGTERRHGTRSGARGGARTAQRGFEADAPVVVGIVPGPEGGGVAGQRGRFGIVATGVARVVVIGDGVSGASDFSSPRFIGPDRAMVGGGQRTAVEQPVGFGQTQA